MAWDPALRTPVIPHRDSPFQPSNAKRTAPESFHNHFQELPHKLRKTEAKSATTNNTPQSHLSSSVQDGTPCKPNITNEPSPTKRNLKPELDFQVELPLKVKYESSVRRFSVPASTSFKDLRLHLAKKMLEDKVMSIEYNDDQGDRVILSSDKDMAEFSRIATARSMNPVQLHVNLWPR